MTFSLMQVLQFCSKARSPKITSIYILHPPTTICYNLSQTLPKTVAGCYALQAADKYATEGISDTPWPLTPAF